MSHFEGKVWGDTSVLLQTPLIEVHKIHIQKGGYCSEHYHKHKWNMFYVIEGELEIHVRKNDYDLIDVTRLSEGDSTTVAPTEYHWFHAVTDVEALEIYYPESLSKDIVRKNVGGK